jgi:hypothetical protein
LTANRDGGGNNPYITIDREVHLNGNVFAEVEWARLKFDLTEAIAFTTTHFFFAGCLVS